MVVSLFADSITVHYISVHALRDSRNLQNLVAISQISWQSLLTLKAGRIGNNGKNWLLNPGTSSQSEGYSSKWLIWLVCRGTPGINYIM